MNTSAPKIRIGCQPAYIALGLLAAWTFVLLFAFINNVQTQYMHAQEMALMQAKALIDKDVMYRKWNANLGGVWGDSTRIDPNPYLKEMRPDRDKETTDGHRLTLINPAYMTRMVFELQNRQLAIEAKITSRKPINPANAPDAWEDTALQAAEKGRMDSKVILEGAQPRLRYLRALVVEEACLACHRKQGYKLGDIRGGISVAVPLTPLYAAATQTLWKQGLSHVLIWLLGVVGIGYGYRSWKNHEALRRESDAELKASRGHYMGIVENSMDGIIGMDADGIIIEFNPAAEDVFGYRREEAIGRRLSEIIVPRAMRAMHEAGLARYLECGAPKILGQRLELTAVRRDGTEFPVEINITQSRDSDGRLIFMGYLRDISARKQSEAVLQQAKEAAETANRAKSEFLANMSHEIRTPMNGVIGMADMLLKTPLGTEQRKMVHTIYDSAHAQLGILNDILDFSKIEAGKMDLSSEPFSLAEVVERTCSNHAAHAQQKAVALRHEVDKRIPPAQEGDSLRVRQILSNFISNAIKFSSGLDHAGEVKVVAQMDNEADGKIWIELSVCDNGIGMDAATLERIFHPFTQADASTTRKYSGTGLGLAISRRLAEVMGGEIRVESTVGAGSTFTVRLPFARADESKLVAATNTRDVSGIASSVPSREEAIEQGRLILVAEDNETNQEVIRQQLGMLGYRSDIVADGREAFSKWLSGEYGLVLSDIHMPNMDGYQLTEAIRTEEAKRGAGRIPILALTANVLKGEAERCRQAGMNGYLSKPVPLSELMGSLVKWLPSEMPIQGGERDTAPQVKVVGEAPVFDPDMLTRMVGGNPAIQRRLLELFLANAQERMTALFVTAETNDAATAGQVAHSLKSAARSVGAMQLGNLCEQIEKAGKAGDADFKLLLPGLTELFEMTRQAIEEHVRAD